MMVADFDLTSLSFTDLTELIGRAESRRSELREEMRARLAKEAELIGVSIQENGKPKRKRRANASKDTD